MTIQQPALSGQLDDFDLGTFGVDPLILSRQSKAGFANNPVSQDTLTCILQAARCAPSFFNTQPWHFIVVEDGPNRYAINSEFLAWGTPWAVEAPILIAAVATDKGTVHGELNYAFMDCGLAVQNLLLQSTAIGLAAHPVMFNDRPYLEDVLGLPQEHHLLLFIAVGYPTGDPVPTFSQRNRKPLSQIATWNSFQGPPIHSIEP